jgi:hypothetical protein
MTPVIEQDGLLTGVDDDEDWGEDDNAPSGVAAGQVSAESLADKLAMSEDLFQVLSDIGDKSAAGGGGRVAAAGLLNIGVEEEEDDDISRLAKSIEAKDNAAYFDSYHLRDKALGFRDPATS